MAMNSAKAASYTRRRYTGESVRQTQRERSGGRISIPRPVGEQMWLEAQLFRALIRDSEDQGYACGIRAVSPGSRTLQIEIGGEHLALAVLRAILPVTYPGEQLEPNIPGLRVRRPERGRLTVTLLGSTARVTLAGAPDRAWRAALHQRRTDVEADGSIALWREPRLHPHEAAYRHALTLSRIPTVAGGGRAIPPDWIASGLLRRINLLNNGARPYYTTGYVNWGPSGHSWVMDLHFAPGNLSHDTLLAMLLDAAFGLPLALEDLYCGCKVTGMIVGEDEISPPCTATLRALTGSRDELVLPFRTARRREALEARALLSGDGIPAERIDAIVPPGLVPPGGFALRDELRRRHRAWLTDCAPEPTA
jgi:hypothetical protein